MGKTGFFCALLVFTACRPAPPPVLSGTWRAQAPDAAVLVIDHREPELKVRSGVTTLTYTTDSSETCNVVDGEMVCSRGRWDGPFLQIDSTIKGEKGDVAVSERWSLSPDGRSLTIRKRGPKSESTVSLVRE